MCLEVEIVEPAMEPAQAMRSGIPIFRVIAFRRRHDPGFQVARFGKSSSEWHAGFRGRTVDFANQNKLVVGVAKGSIENPEVSPWNNRPGFPGLEIMGGEHVHGFASFCSGNIDRGAIYKGAAEFMAVSKRWKRLSGFMIDQTEVIRFP